MRSENAAINETRESQTSATKLKPLYIRVPQIMASAFLVIGHASYAQQSADKQVISLSTVSKLDRNQAGIYRTKVGKIDVIAVSDGTVGLGLTKELVQNARPGEVERLLARHFDAAAAAATRRQLLEDAARKCYIVAPGHLPFPGFGHIRKYGHAYTWVPVDYVNDAVEK